MMQPFLKACAVSLAALAAATSAQAAPIVSTFEELSLAPSSHYFPETTATFTSGAATFEHRYNSDYGSWSGWTFGNETDRVTEGFENQFSVYNAAAAGGSQNFALAYVSAYEGVPTAITFEAPVLAGSVALTNNTYAALSMKNGDSFAKKFGGASGNDADWLLLSIIGKDALGATTGTVDFYLADYRFADNSQDYILDQWAHVDLTSLGAVSSIEFQMTSSDTGLYGINTPTYFALDNLSVTAAAVPEASTLAMMLLGLGFMAGAVRRQSRR
ncbi:MAG: DUF4465 domain-containing protein [Pseudomonadota bacterium]